MGTVVAPIVALLVLGGLVYLLVRVVRVRPKHACPKGLRTTIIANFGTGMARTFVVRFVARDGGPVAGRFVERKYFWIFPRAPREGALASELTFRRDWINALYRVEVLPDADLEVDVR